MANNLIKIHEPTTQPENKNIQPETPSLFDHVIFDLPFRAFFLLAPAFAIISLSIWLAFLNGWFNFNAAGLTPIIWHVHEMTFGFAATIAVAFILTAVQTWTGKRSLHGRSLALLIFLWITVRALLLLNSEYSLYIATVLQALWWLAVLFIYARLVISARNRRNYLFIPILFLMAIMNGFILFSDLSGNTNIALHLSRSMILVFVLLMSLVGGRVIPFFTVRGAHTKVITTPTWVPFLLVIVSILGLVIFILSELVNLPLNPAIFMIAASFLHFIRLIYWRSLKTLFVPLLWSLHLSYLFISLGMLMLGLSYYQIGIGFSNALHIITIGAISLMILSMINRVSLGHTNRELKVNKLIIFSFYIMVIAAFIRSFFPYFSNALLPILLPNISISIPFAWNLSGFLWLSSLCIFLKTYWPILTSAKQ